MNGASWLCNCTIFDLVKQIWSNIVQFHKKKKVSAKVFGTTEQIKKPQNSVQENRFIRRRQVFTGTSSNTSLIEGLFVSAHSRDSHIK